MLQGMPVQVSMQTGEPKAHEGYYGYVGLVAANRYRGTWRVPSTKAMEVWQRGPGIVYCRVEQGSATLMPPIGLEG